MKLFLQLIILISIELLNLDCSILNSISTINLTNFKYTGPSSCIQNGQVSCEISKWMLYHQVHYHQTRDGVFTVLPFLGSAVLLATRTVCQ
jgi:hypothetical protein